MRALPLLMAAVVVAATYPAFVERRDVHSVARELADLPRYALVPVARLDPGPRRAPPAAALSPVT